MADQELLQRIADAKAKYHQLMTGSANVVSITYQDRTVQYRNFATDTDKLLIYINQLETEAGLKHPRRPMGVVF